MPQQPPNKSPLQSTLNVFCCQNLVVELNEQNEELWLGGSFSEEDRLRPKLGSRDYGTRVTNQYGIRSIPTLMF